MLPACGTASFWRRLEQHLGAGYARTWAGDQVLRELDGRTVAQALEAGETPLVVWRAVHQALALPARER